MSEPTCKTCRWWARNRYDRELREYAGLCGRHQYSSFESVGCLEHVPREVRRGGSNPNPRAEPRDLVERLRRNGSASYLEAHEAADEIERLRGIVEKAREEGRRAGVEDAAKIARGDPQNGDPTHIGIAADIRTLIKEPRT